MTQYTVTVTDDHVDRIDEVAERLRSQGLEVGAVLPELGLIMIEADPSAVEQTTSLEGVDSVSETADYQLPPPDAPIQ